MIHLQCTYGDLWRPFRPKAYCDSKRPLRGRGVAILSAQFAGLCLSPFILLLSQKCWFLCLKEKCHQSDSSLWPTLKVFSPSLNSGKPPEQISVGSFIMTRLKINLLPYLFQVFHLSLLQTKQSGNQTSPTTSLHWKPALFPWGNKWFHLYLPKMVGRVTRK